MSLRTEWVMHSMLISSPRQKSVYPFSMAIPSCINPESTHNSYGTLRNYFVVSVACLISLLLSSIDIYLSIQYHSRCKTK